MSKQRKKGTVVWGFLYVAAFLLSFAASAVVKMTYNPLGAQYAVHWDDSVGTIYTDLSYGDGEANKFDLYVPADRSQKTYGLVVYLHAGGFTSGDKAGDADMLKRFCSMGFVAAGINYTLRTEHNECVFEAVGPASFHHEDWTPYGLDQSPEAAAGLFSVMSGNTITPEMVIADDYQEEMKNISAYQWVTEDSPPTLCAYGAYDKVCPFASAKHLIHALEEHNVPYDYIVFPHSGHGLQNDNQLYAEYMDRMIAYLDQYM